MNDEKKQSVAFSFLFLSGLGIIFCIMAVFVKGIVAPTKIIQIATWLRIVAWISFILFWVSFIMCAYYKRKIINDPMSDFNTSNRRKLWMDCMECNKYITRMNYHIQRENNDRAIKSNKYCNILDDRISDD